MAAATALFDAMPSGTHVVAPKQMYWTIRRWLQAEESAGHVTLTLVDNDDLAEWREALAAGGSPLAWLETPANPMTDITDLEAVAAIAHEAGAVVAADNTTAKGREQNRRVMVRFFAPAE